MAIPAPRWDMSGIYPSLDSEEFKTALADYKKQIALFERFFNNKVDKANARTKVSDLAFLVEKILNQINEIFTLGGTIGPYIISYTSTDSRNNLAKKTLSEFEQAGLPMNKLMIRFNAWLGKVEPRLDRVIESSKTASAHALMLREATKRSKYLMSEAEEALAAELTLSGGNAFKKLQGIVTSQLSVNFELYDRIQKLPMPALINLRSHPDEAIRRRAYEAENKAWAGVEEILAACINGVKGEVDTLNKKCGRKDAIHSSLDSARIDRKTFNVMMTAIKDSFPMFRRYWHAKARKLGKKKLAWWDIFAPVGKMDKVYAFEEARDFIIENFGKFSPDLAAFSARAFDNNWIDAEQREGKRGNAFCRTVQGAKESRVLVNFDGSFSQVCTLAHELGHAFHSECAFQAGKTPLQQHTPMSLAETASTMCEIIITEAVLSSVKKTMEELTILEAQMQVAGLNVVDIYSRYLFEKEVFERREKFELSADELNDIMERAQKDAYGDGLDERYLQKFMWTWKPHYYFPGFSFYNYPYAFGLLFATGLYVIYLQRGVDFVKSYKDLLASTGEESPVNLAKRFGMDITKRKFWDDSLAVIGRRIDRYDEL